MPGQPLVSVIIPAHNAEPFIDEAIRSVLGQTYSNIELIVVDDGSTDGTRARVAAYAPRVHLIRHAHASGNASVPRNTGIRHSKGEYLVFLDADDIMFRERVAKRLDYLSRHPDVGIVFSDYRNFSADEQVAQSHFQSCPRLWKMLGGRSSLVLSSEEATSLLAQENFGIAGAFMLRRALLELEPGFEPTLHACEDFHFYFRLARHRPVGILNEVGLMRRLHEGNMTLNSRRMLSEGVRSRALLREGESNPTTRRLLDRYIAECHAGLARLHAERGAYLQAIREDARALCRDFSGPRFRASCKGLARTIAIATGAHRPRVGASR